MEKIPNFKIIGSGSEEEKAKVEDTLEKRLYDNRGFISERDIDRLKALEYPKGDVEHAAINFSNRYTSALLERAGIPNFDILANNYFIMPNDEYLKVADPDSNATAFTLRKVTALNALKVRSKPLFIAMVILHETTHLKSFLSVELSEGEKAEDKSLFRDGVIVYSSEKKDEEAGFSHSHFKGLQEAIIANLEKRAFSEMSKLPELQDEIARLNTPEILEKRKKISEKKKIPIEDILWVSDTTEDYNWVAYPRTRFVLDYVCDEIQKEFSDEYKSSEEVFQEFSNAQFNGNLMTIARLVDGAFGKGSFRILGNMDTDANSAALCMETLKKLRLQKA